MTVLIDTHFLLWIIEGSPRLRSYPWVKKYSPYGISPISILELQFLSEVGKIQLDVLGFMSNLARDPRFLLDDTPLLQLIKEAVHLGWTRDPFDRLLAAHSLARRVPLCTVDAVIRRHHGLLPPELA